MYAHNNNIYLEFKNIKWFHKNYFSVNKICFPSGKVQSEYSYLVMGKSSQKYVSNKVVDNSFNEFDYNKSINWLHADAAVNNLKDKEHIF